MKNTTKAKLCFLFIMVGCFVGSQNAISKKYKGGFKETTEQPSEESFEIMTIEQAKNSKDDTFVVLQGYIDKSLGNEKYQFRDETGTIRIEIKDKKFRGLTVYPNDLVQISGEVDKGWLSQTEIEVKNISKINQTKENN